MKYSEYHSKKRFKGGAAFYAVIACCLLALGGASWFAASRISRRDTGGGNSGSEQSDVISAPSISSTEPSGKAGQTAENVSSEPYSSAQSSQEAEETKKPTVFTLPVQGEIIKKYSESELLYSATYGDMRVHHGIDIACEDSTAVSAAADGKVVSVEDTAFFGTVVTIDHGDGITAKYSALKDIKVKAGDSVTAGDIIGAVTAVPDECADQSHLHLEVQKNGHDADPVKTLGLK